MKKTLQKTRYTLAILSLVLGLNFVFFAPVASARLFDGAKEQACAGAQLSATSGPNCTQDDQNALSETITSGVSLVTIIVGVIAVIMIIIGGIRFIVANGDSGKVTSARNTIVYALIGLVLVAFAQVIVKFVLSRV